MVLKIFSLVSKVFEIIMKKNFDMIYFCKMTSTKQALRNWHKCFRKSVGVKGWTALWLLRQSIQLSVAWWVKVTHCPSGMPSKMNYTEKREDAKTEPWSIHLINGRHLCFLLKAWLCSPQVVRVRGLDGAVQASLFLFAFSVSLTIYKSA